MLTVNGLRKAYRAPDGTEVPILDLPDLSIQSGEQVVLRGNSGSGKTTLLHIISGIVRADSGSILLDGTDLTKLSEAARDRFRAAKIGYVFQTFNLLPAFTALENVRLGMTFGRGRYHLDRAKVLLDQVGLADRMHYRPSMLSVGQQQRVAVARALANQPSILLADEPTANVDPANQQKVIELLRQACQTEKTSLLLVTHSDSVASQFDRIEKLDQLNRVVASIHVSHGGKA